MYALADFSLLAGATVARDPVIEIPNRDALDPFGA